MTGSKTVAAIAEFVEATPFFDTHSHLAGLDVGTPVVDTMPLSLTQVLMNDYLLYAASSCTDLPAEPVGGWKAEDARAHFKAVLPLLERMRATTIYAAAREGVRELHGFDEADITLDNFDDINERVTRAYTTFGQRKWQRMACKRVGVVRQTHMAQLSYVVDHLGALPLEERNRQLAIQLPSLILDGFFFTGFALSREGFDRAQDILGIHPRTLDEHIALCEAAIDRFIAGGGGSVKLLSAYHRTLRFEKVPDSEAASLYRRGPENLDGGDLHRLQDAIVWHLLRIAHSRGLPLIVHCGYSNPIDFGDAEHLRPLLTDPELSGLKIDVCHSNWPREGAATIMARTYRGCYFNVCWTPMLSETLGERILSEAIELVPMNKILMGTDCATAESFVGTARIMKRVLTNALAAKVDRGMFSLDVAKQVARCLLVDNALEFYGKWADVRSWQSA